jgi:hypothetical protein
MSTRPDIALGDVVKDTITGFKGVVVSRHDYLNGCVRLGIQPKGLKDGKPIEAQVFDIEQCELVTAAKPRAVKPSGGPRNDPARPAAPPR